MDNTVPPDAFVQVDHLVKSYRRGQAEVSVLRGIDCAIAESSFTFIVGPSGSGKSTLLYLLGGLDRPTAGEISIDGQKLSQLSAGQLDQLRREQIGFIFQSFNLLKTLTCLDNVLAPFIPTGESKSKRAVAEHLLERVGLADRMHHRPNELSGGEQQRVAIARAVLKQPKLILADEPTGELDSETGRAVFSILRELNAEQGTTVITVTHDHRYMEHGDLILQMQDGQFVTGQGEKHEFATQA